MAPIKIRDLSLPAFTDFSLAVRWKSGGVPKDVTLWVPKAEIRTRRDGVLVDEFSVEKTATPTDGYFVMSLLPEQSLPLVGDENEYSLVVTQGLQIVELLRGRLYVAKRITVLP